MVTGTDATTTQAHVPDYETCERIAYPSGACNFYHDYTVQLVGSYSVGAWGSSRGAITLTVNVLTGAVSCGNCQGGSGLEIWAPPAPDVCAPPSDGVIRTLTNFTPYAGVGMAQAPSCDNGMVAVFNIRHSRQNVETLHTGTLTVNIFNVVDHGWTSDPGCEAFLTNVAGDSILKPAVPPPATDSYTCSQGPCETATEITGTWVDQSVLPSPNPFASVGISNLATEVTVALADFNQGQMNCYTDTQGEVHCPQNTGGQNDTCTALENNPACSYVSQPCIEGAQDPTDNTCYAWDCSLRLRHRCGYQRRDHHHGLFLRRGDPLHGGGMR